jgi:hypothetical protein
MAALTRSFVGRDTTLFAASPQQCRRLSDQLSTDPDRCAAGTAAVGDFPFIAAAAMIFGGRGERANELGADRSLQPTTPH